MNHDSLVTWMWRQKYQAEIESLRQENRELKQMVKSLLQRQRFVAGEEKKFETKSGVTNLNPDKMTSCL